MALSSAGRRRSRDAGQPRVDVPPGLGLGGERVRRVGSGPGCRRWRDAQTQGLARGAPERALQRRGAGRRGRHGGPLERRAELATIPRRNATTWLSSVARRARLRSERGRAWRGGAWRPRRCACHRTRRSRAVTEAARSSRLDASGPVVRAVPKEGRSSPATRTAEARAAREASPRQRPIVRRSRGDPFRREATRERSQTGALAPAAHDVRAPRARGRRRPPDVPGPRTQTARPRDAAPSSGRPADEGSAASTPPTSTRLHGSERRGCDGRESPSSAESAPGTRPGAAGARSSSTGRSPPHEPPATPARRRCPRRPRR